MRKCFASVPLGDTFPQIGELEIRKLQILIAVHFSADPGCSEASPLGIPAYLRTAENAGNRRYKLRLGRTDKAVSVHRSINHDVYTVEKK